jgi:hypothetical protein
MPRPRTAMRKIRDVLRLTFAEQLSRRRQRNLSRHPGHRPGAAGVSRISRRARAICGSVIALGGPAGRSTSNRH